MSDQPLQGFTPRMLIHTLMDRPDPRANKFTMDGQTTRYIMKKGQRLVIDDGDIRYEDVDRFEVFRDAAGEKNCTLVFFFQGDDEVFDCYLTEPMNVGLTQAMRIF